MRELDPKAIKEFKNLKLKNLYFIGDISLIEKPKISIVGTRRPSSYTKEFTFKLANELTKRGYIIVSGAAMGVDALAHKGAGAFNTIAVMASGLDIRYPAVNRSLIQEIEQNGLVISRFKKGFRPTPWSFVVRNEMVVALGECLIVTEANLNSGSMRSVEFSLKQKKQIYVLPHRANESDGVNYLLKNSLAKPIYDIDQFCNSLKPIKKVDDPFVKYLKSSPLYEDAIKRFSNRVFEAELRGEIEVINGKVIYKDKGA